MGVVRVEAPRRLRRGLLPTGTSYSRCLAGLFAGVLLGKFGTRPAYTQTSLRGSRWPGAYLRGGEGLCAAPDAETCGGPAASVSCDAAWGFPSLCLLLCMCLCVLPGVRRQCSCMCVTVSVWTPAGCTGGWRGWAAAA